MRQRRIKRTKQVVQEALDQGRSRSLSSRTTAAFPNKGMGHELDGDQREEAGSVKSNHSKVKKYRESIFLFHFLFVATVTNSLGVHQLSLTMLVLFFVFNCVQSKQ
ncbi:uncharacterized protein LOC144040363 isoform X2 [Vanacampus margaritifer]